MLKFWFPRRKPFSSWKYLSSIENVWTIPDTMFQRKKMIWRLLTAWAWNLSMGRRKNYLGFCRITGPISVLFLPTLWRGLLLVFKLYLIPVHHACTLISRTWINNVVLISRKHFQTRTEKDTFPGLLYKDLCCVGLLKNKQINKTDWLLDDVDSQNCRAD